MCMADNDLMIRDECNFVNCVSVAGVAMLCPSSVVRFPELARPAVDRIKLAGLYWCWRR